MPTRRATWLMRSKRRPPCFADSLDKFFVLDTAPGFLSLQDYSKVPGAQATTKNRSSKDIFAAGGEVMRSDAFFRQLGSLFGGIFAVVLLTAIILIAAPFTGAQS